MKVLHISTYDKGGAAIACIRLHEALLEAGIDSKLLTLHRSTYSIPEHYCYTNLKVDQIPSRYERIFNKITGIEKRAKKKEAVEKRKRKLFLNEVVREYEHFSFPQSKFDITTVPLLDWADIINLHWVSDFIDFPSFFEKTASKKVVWTLHDMNSFTGGCHYASDCVAYKIDCKSCPQTQNTQLPDQAQNTLTLKKNVFEKKTGVRAIVAPSHWLSKCASPSMLFHQMKHCVIPYSLNTNHFKMLNKSACRQALELPEDKKILLFVSSKINNKRKGFDMLLKSINYLSEKDDLVICSVGELRTEIQFNRIKHIALGSVQDEKLMNIIYNAADVFIIPSREDNLPNVVLESLACGTPVIGFDVGGISDMIVNNFNGILCKETNEMALAKAIDEFIADKYNFFDKEKIANDTKHKYSSSVQASAYSKLYKSLLKSEVYADSIQE